MATRRRSVNDSIWQLKVTLRDIRPPIWRRIQVSGDTSLYNLHLIIQDTMGWENYHLYDFEIGETHYGEPAPEWGLETKDASRQKLSQVLPGEKAKLHYVYDMGDNWEHEIVVEKILLAEAEKRYPACIARKRACPPEDCGGIWGYSELLEIIEDPDHAEYEERMNCLGGELNPEAFLLEVINQGLMGTPRKGACRPTDLILANVRLDKWGPP